MEEERKLGRGGDSLGHGESIPQRRGAKRAWKRNAAERRGLPRGGELEEGENPSELLASHRLARSVCGTPTS